VVGDPARPDLLASAARPALTSSYAQARFVVGGTVREVRYVVPDPTATMALDLRQRLACQLAGLTLVRNHRLHLGEAAELQLRAGNVDPRLLTAVAGILARYDLTIDDFPAVRGEENTQVMRRVARLGAVAGTPAARSLVLRGWLTAQLPLYRPAALSTDQGVLVIRYDPPTPIGLLVS
jgi:hypothetical protein